MMLLQHVAFLSGIRNIYTIYIYIYIFIPSPPPGVRWGREGSLGIANPSKA